LNFSKARSAHKFYFSESNEYQESECTKMANVHDCTLHSDAVPADTDRELNRLEAFGVQKFALLCLYYHDIGGMNAGFWAACDYLVEIVIPIVRLGGNYLVCRRCITILGGLLDVFELLESRDGVPLADLFWERPNLPHHWAL
jgi:hypothetical protein